MDGPEWLGAGVTGIVYAVAIDTNAATSSGASDEGRKQRRRSAPRHRATPFGSRFRIRLPCSHRRLSSDVRISPAGTYVVPQRADLVCTILRASPVRAACRGRCEKAGSSSLFICSRSSTISTGKRAWAEQSVHSASAPAGAFSHQSFPVPSTLCWLSSCDRFVSRFAAGAVSHPYFPSRAIVLTGNARCFGFESHYRRMFFYTSFRKGL